MRDLLAVAEEHGVAAADGALFPLVHLVERRAARAGLADPDGDGEQLVRDRQHLGRRPRALRSEDEARQVGARLGCDGDVLLAGQSADLDERAREELAQLLARVGRLHQRRADEDRVGARELGGGALRARVDAALGDRDPVGRDARDELELRAAGRSRRSRGRVR